MKDLMKSLEQLPWYVKLILCIPVLDIVWAIYRIAKSYYAQNTLGIILGILLIIPGAVFVWAVDAVCVIINKEVWWFC
ncbi:MAG: hypothetical protein J6B45_03685 [Clostridia bacterium]|nr:hypothetical protein [Clostridia bacterium]